jgi:phosphoribosyl-ATP pyrophosphohydrolase
MAAFTLSELAARVRERATSSPEVSYTRELLDRGVSHCAKKLGEEALELAIAAVAEDRDRVIAEAADLLYHFVVVLQSRGIALSEVEVALERRSSMSGLDEKKLRPRE